MCECVCGGEQLALNSFAPLMSTVPSLLNVVDRFHATLGTPLMRAISGLIGPLLGLSWHPYLPRGAARLATPAPAVAERPTVVYMAACVTRAMGPARGDGESDPVHHKVVKVLEKAGYNVLMPADAGAAAGGAGGGRGVRGVRRCWRGCG